MGTPQATHGEALAITNRHRDVERDVEPSVEHGVYYRNTADTEPTFEIGCRRGPLDYCGTAEVGTPCDVAGPQHARTPLDECIDDSGPKRSP